MKNAIKQMEYLRQQQEEINRVKQKRQEEERIRREQLIKEQEMANQEQEVIPEPEENKNEILHDQDNQNYENAPFNEEATNNEPQPQEYFDIIKDNLENQQETNEQSFRKNSETQEPEQKEEPGENDDMQLEGGEGDQENEQNEKNANEYPQQELEINPEQENEYNNPEFHEQIPNEEVLHESNEQEKFRYDNVGGTTYLDQEVNENNNEQPDNAEQDDQNFEETEEVIDINQDQDDQMSREDSIDIDQEEQLNIEIESLQYEAEENKEKLKSLKFMMEKLNLLSKATFSEYVDILFSC